MPLRSLGTNHVLEVQFGIACHQAILAPVLIVLHSFGKIRGRLEGLQRNRTVGNHRAQDGITLFTESCNQLV